MGIHGYTWVYSNLFPLVFPSLFKLWSRKRWLPPSEEGVHSVTGEGWVGKRQPTRDRDQVKGRP